MVNKKKEKNRKADSSGENKVKEPDEEGDKNLEKEVEEAVEEAEEKVEEAEGEAEGEVGEAVEEAGENFEDFSEFERDSESSEVIAPVLEDTGLTQDVGVEELESELENVPSTSEGERREEQYAVNMPDYGSNYEQAINYENTDRQEREAQEEDREIIARPLLRQETFEMQDIRPLKQTQPVWRQEMAQQRERHIEEDYQVGIREKDRRRDKLPHEQ